MKRATSVYASIVLASALAATNLAAAPASAITRSEVAGLSPTAPALVLGPEGTAYDPPNNPPAWYAVAEAHDSGTAASPTRPVYAGYSKHFDLDGYVVPGQLVSVNKGATFSTSTQPAYEASARLIDGRVVHAEFIGQTSVTLQQRTIRIHYSNDDGATFPTTVVANLNIAPQTFFHATANYFPTSMVQVPNGPLLMAGYGILRDSAGNAVQTSLLLVSFDSGASWTLRSTIAQGSTSHGFNETGIVLTADGALLAVMRTSNYDNLYERRSTTFGTSWASGPVGIPEFADTGGVRAFGRINPRLSLLPNGILALVAGRPDNYVALSYDGTGNAWNIKKMYYDNHNTAQPTDVNEGSSGNADFAWTEANRAVLLADTCHAITYQGTHYNKCTWQGGTMSGGTTQYQIKRVQADILTAGAGKIDLAGKVAAGVAQIGGDMGDAVAGHPRTGALGAVDGSNEMWSSAVRSGGPGTFEITLDRAYTLSKVGLSLAIGAAESATVQTRMTLEEPWLDWYTVSGQQSYALKYSASAPARQARYVRVLAGTASACPAGIAAPCSILNEIELHASDVNSFENDPVNGIPRGYSIDHTVDDQGVGYLGVWVT
ncbi:MAG TPA: sialidase family protein, partial [Candidatus Limnocylindrales bacterium]